MTIMSAASRFWAFLLKTNFSFPRVGPSNRWMVVASRPVTSDSRFAVKPLPFVLLGGTGTALMLVLWAGIPPALRLPVLVYAGVLLAMAAQAASRALDRRTPLAVAAAIGAILFVASDSLLALKRFGYPIPASRVLVLAPYFVAQWLIALSATTPRRR